MALEEAHGSFWITLGAFCRQGLLRRELTWQQVSYGQLGGL